VDFARADINPHITEMIQAEAPQKTSSHADTHTFTRLRSIGHLSWRHKGAAFLTAKPHGGFPAMKLLTVL